MLDLESQKARFKDHIATFTDYGNIKILDFKKPDSIEYRIRFMFEEDFCRLHITGDLGDLIASNYDNMTYDKFYDFVDNAGYFEEKIDCMSRTVYFYDRDKAVEDLKGLIEEYQIADELIENTFNDSIEQVIDEVLENFADQDEVLKYLTSVMRKKSEASVLARNEMGADEVIEKPPDEKEALKAAELLGKRYGLWTEKIEQQIDMELNISVDYGDE